MVIKYTGDNVIIFFEDQGAGSIPIARTGMKARNSPRFPAFALVCDDPKGQ